LSWPIKFETSWLLLLRTRNKGRGQALHPARSLLPGAASLTGTRLAPPGPGPLQVEGDFEILNLDIGDSAMHHYPTSPFSRAPGMYFITNDSLNTYWVHFVGGLMHTLLGQEGVAMTLASQGSEK
jgi:hypothetical protein